MSLLAPLFLLGILAVAAPIAAHFLRRRTAQRVQFSATRFLDVSAPVAARRRELEHPWLLLLRALVVALLALAFARPFFSSLPETPLSGPPPRSVVVVVDQSASMQRTGIPEQVRSRFRAIADPLGPADSLAVVGTAETIPVIDVQTWRNATASTRVSLLESAEEAIAPGWGATSLDDALVRALEAAESMRETPGDVVPVEIVLLSDLAASAELSGLAGLDWPDHAYLRTEPILPTATPNASLHFLGWSAESEAPRRARLSLVNHSDTDLQVGVDAFDAVSQEPVRPTDSYALAPRERRIIAIQIPDTPVDAVRVELSGDGEPFDDSVWIAAPSTLRIPVAYLGSDRADDPRRARFFIERALEPRDGFEARLLSLDSATDGILPEASLFVVNGALQPRLVAVLRERLERGAHVLLLAAGADQLSLAAELVREGAWTPATQVPGSEDARLASIDFDHPQFAVFADPRFSNFIHIRFWRPVPIALPESTRARVVARFEGGAAAVVEASVGSGRLLVWGGDWTPNSSQWVLSTKFVPWLRSLALRSAGGPLPDAQDEVGSWRSAADTVRWQPLDGPVAASPSTAIPSAPGLLQVDEGRGPRLLALNHPASESESRILPPDTWARLGVATRPPQMDPAAVPAARDRLRASELEAAQSIWRWVLLAVVLLLVLESIVSLRTARAGAPVSTSP
jgi:hypothetical protein